ncbi:ABC-type amino acid transport/signal transduction system, periplasmic component/domain [Candidatus Burkholderia humilis]|nr:ABC-type amino acid transport/signal transduction system, periplasmic component/domain [Candidatus Burkholderia humilis]
MDAKYLSGKLRLGALAGAFALIATSVQAKEWTSVTIATEGAYAPWNQTLPGGKLGGFEPELLTTLCTHAQLKCNLVAQDRDGMIPGLQAGKFDILMDVISITPEREKIIAFSRPYASTPATFAVSDDAVLPKASPNDQAVVDGLRKQLKGKTIGIQSGTVYTKFIQDNFKDVAKICVYKTAQERDLDLANGRIEASFDDLTYFTSGAVDKSIFVAGPKIGGPIWGPGEGLGFRKQDADLKAKFDAALASAIADGTVKTLSEKWFKTNVAP